LCANPTSAIALADCDSGGVNNATECENGADPLDPSDDCPYESCSSPEEGFCTPIEEIRLLTNFFGIIYDPGLPVTQFAMFEADAEATYGGDWTVTYSDGVICISFSGTTSTPQIRVISVNPDGSGLATKPWLGVNCETVPCEPTCEDGSADPIAFCNFVSANPESEIATADCDGGGISNATECSSGDDPFDSNDDYDCNNIPTEEFNICTYLEANPELIQMMTTIVIRQIRMV